MRPRVSAKTPTQMMKDLPASRVNPFRALEESGSTSPDLSLSKVHINGSQQILNHIYHVFLFVCARKPYILIGLESFNRGIFINLTTI